MHIMIRETVTVTPLARIHMKSLQIEAIVESTKNWLDYLDYKGRNEADEGDILIALGSDNTELLAELNAKPHSEYLRIINEVLSALDKDSADEEDEAQELV